MTFSSLTHLKTSSLQQKSMDPPSSKTKPKESFEKCMKVEAVDEEPKYQDLFSLIEQEEEKKELEKEEALSEAIALMPQPLAPPPAVTSITAQRIQADITAIEMGVLFEKMAASMILLHNSGEMETTLFLDNPNSLFYGTEITIREFSTAPKIFNVEIASSPTALQVIESHRAELLKNFSQRHFDFSIHRLDTLTQHLDKRPFFHRKDLHEQGQDKEKS